MSKTPIAIAFGDGIGPSIMQAVLHILNEAKCPLEYHSILIGEKAYHQGFTAGIELSAWDKINSTKALLISPSMSPTPQHENINDTLVKNLGLFANIRPCISYFPFIKTKHPEMDVLVVRENMEDLYCKVEYIQSPDTAKADKIITYSSCKKTIQFAFEYAKKYNHKKVTCMTKDNILTKTDGLFHAVFNEVSNDYPEVIKEHYIIDTGAAELATNPEIFDIIVLPNLYGDILSSILTKMCGSIEICTSVNIGDGYATFGTVHGPEVDIANKDSANPSALLLAAIQMLNYLKLSEYAADIYSAWLSTIEEGLHTEDLFHSEHSKKKLGTEDFAKEVIKRLGKKNTISNKSSFFQNAMFSPGYSETQKSNKRELVGVDITVFSDKGIGDFFDKVSHANEANLHLKTIMNRGIQIWPKNNLKSGLCTQYCLRFLNNDLKAVSQDIITKLLLDFNRVKVEVLSLEYLYLIDNKLGF